MTTPHNLDTLLQRVAAQDRPTIVDDVVARLEEALARALRGDMLRGLRNLGTSTVPYYGVRLDVSSWSDDKRQSRIAFPSHREAERGDAAVVLDDRGRVRRVYAKRMRSTLTAPTEWFTFEHEAVRLTAEQLTRLVAILPDILTEHMRLTDREAVAVDAARDKAEALLDAMTRPSSAGEG